VTAAEIDHVPPGSRAATLTAILAAADQAEAAAQAARDRTMRLQHADYAAYVSSIPAMERADQVARDARQRAEQARDLAADPAEARAALAEATEGAHSAHQATAAARAARDRVLEQKAAAESALEQAGVAVERARKQHAKRVAKGECPGDVEATKSARSELQAAEDVVDATAAALAEIEDDLAAAQQAERDAADQVARCADAVLAGPAHQLMAEIEALLAQVSHKRAMLRLMARGAGDVRSRAIAAFLASDPFHREHDDPAIVEKWQRARAALLQDADAPLPEL
jgi:DNA repair exonuclease SbcCD ATPase subunit